MIKKFILFVGLMMVASASLFAATFSISSITKVTSSPTFSTSVTWRVNFGRSVSGVVGNLTAFSVSTISGTLSGTPSVTSVTLSSGNSYDVVVSGITVTSANAVLALDIPSGVTTITDGSSNTPSAFTMLSAQRITVDQTAPSAPTLTYPNSTLISNGTVNVQLQLSENPKSSSVNLIFTDASSNAYTYVLSVANTANTIFTFNINNVVSTSTGQIVSASPSSTLPSGTYTVTLNFKDLAGNTSATVTQSNVFINNNPSFIGTTSLSFCDNTLNNDISANLIVRDLDNGQTLTWSENYSPNAHGTLSGFSTTRTSNGSTRIPLLVTYTPDAGFFGNDSFSISVDDGLGGTSSQTFHVTVAETKAYYRDLDNDTYGDINDRKFVCTGTPGGYVLDSSDCNDNAATMHAKYPFYQDNDLDGYGTTVSDSVCAVDASTPITAYSLVNTDCNDALDSVWTSTSLYLDADGDTYDAGSSLQCHGTRALLNYSYTTSGSDCNDALDSVWTSASLYIDVDADGYNAGTSTQCYGTRALLGYALTTLGSDCNDALDSVWTSTSLYLDADGDTYDAGSSLQCHGTRALLNYSYTTSGSDCNDALDSVWTSASLYIDVDADGYDAGTSTQCYGTRALLGYALTTLGSDCNDADNTMHNTFPFYVDTDLDGTGAGTWQPVCSSSGTSIPTGYSLDSTDCDNANAAIINPIRYFVDADGDGYGTNIGTGSIVYFCQTSAPTGYSSDSTDCNDAAATKHALFSTFYTDADGDTYGDMNGSLISNVCAVDALTAPTNYSVNNTDCNDADATMNAYFAFYSDNDGDTYGAGSLNLNVCAVDGLTPPSTAYVLNNTDCDDNNILKNATFPFYTDADGDTYGSSILTNQCAVNGTTPPSLTYVTNATDCNDADAAKHDNFTFYVDADGDTYGSSTTSVLCAIDINTPPSTGYSTNSTDCDDNEALLHSPIRYYLDADNDTYGTIDIFKDTCSLTAPLGYVSNSGDCDDNNVAVHTNSLIVNVSLSVYPSNIIYTGHVATFTAAFTNGGSAPSFQWFKNGIPVVTSSAITYSYIPNNGDVIKCVLTSNLKCTISPTDTSNSISIIVTNPPSVQNDYPCGAISASTNSGNISGLPTVKSAYDNGGSVYSGLDNRDVTSNPPSGPSLIYYNVNCTAAGNAGDPASTCNSTASNSVWYKFRAPTFEAGITIRSQLSYGQVFIPVMTAYVISSGTACNSGVFTELQCSSTGTLTLSSSLLNTYLGQTIYLMVQNPTTEQQCNYTVSIQGVVPDITLSNPTTTTLDVAFPTFSLTAPTKITLYWQRVGSNGTSYINLPGSTSSYTIGGLLSGNSYRVWAKFITVGTGSQIYCTAKILGTITGCGGNLPAPTISANGVHCSSVYANFTNPPASVPNGLQSAPSSYPYRLIWFKGGRGQIQALSSVPSGGYLISNLTMGATYNVYYSYKCLGGAIMTSNATQHTACFGVPRTDNSNHEYIVNGVHYVNVDLEEVINAATSTMEINDENIHDFQIEEVTTENNNTATNSITTESNFELVPNPATNNVTINYNLSATESSTLKYQLMDIQGKVVFETIVQNPSNAGSIQVNLTSLNEGIYLVNLQSNGFNSTKKLIVSK